MNYCLNEFLQLLNFSKIYNNKDKIKYRNNIPQFIIKSDFILHTKKEINNVHIHFNYKCTGSDEFKNLLEKFNLYMEWFDNYTLLLFHK